MIAVTLVMNHHEWCQHWCRASNLWEISKEHHGGFKHGSLKDFKSNTVTKANGELYTVESKCYASIIVMQS